MRRIGLAPVILFPFCLLLCCTACNPVLASPPQDKALIAAIDKQDPVRVNALLAAGADPNAKTADDDSRTALDHAAEVGSTPICEALLKKGARVDGDPDARMTPLFRAAANKHASVVKLLLEHGANANAVAGIYGSALSVAGTTGQLDVMQMLLDRGANLQLDRKTGNFPLAAAAAEGQKAAVEWLLTHGARIDDVGEDGASTLITAATAGRLDIVDLLVARGAQVNLDDTSGNTALELAKGPQRAAIIAALRKAGTKDPVPTLFRAVKKNDTRMLRELLGNGADPNEQDTVGRTPLFYSMDHLDFVVLKALLESGVDPNARDKQGVTPLSVAKEDHISAVEPLLAAGAYALELEMSAAIQENDIKAVTALLDAKADPNSTDLQGRSPLENALNAGHPEILRLLVSRRANVNAVDKDEWTPLRMAVSNGNLADVRFLLENGADAKAISSDGQNVLMFAQKPGSLELIRLLVEHGASVRGRIKDNNRSVFEMLAESADAPTIQFLLDNGAGPDINSKDTDGGTPLAGAARGGNLEVVQLLLAKGADINTVDSAGDTPVHHAVFGMSGAKEEASRERARERRAAKATLGGAKAPAVLEKPRDRVADGAAVIGLLAKHGANLEIRDKAGKTPMAVALEGDAPEALDALRREGAHFPKPQSPQSLVAAAQDDDLDGVHKLLAKGANPNAADKFGFTPLALAALRGDLDIVKELLLHGAKPDYRVKDENGILSTTPLLLAAEQGNNEIVKLLLKHGANANIPLSEYDFLLYEVVGKGHGDTLRILLETGMDVNAGEKYGQTPLMRAAGLIGGEDTVRLLLAKGAHVNGKFASGITPLMKAAEAGRGDNVHAMLRAGADIKAHSDEGETVLMYAVKSGQIDVVHLVLGASMAAHLDINARDKQNKTALSLALDQHFEEIARVLKESGAKE